MSIGADAPVQNQRFTCTAENRAGSDTQYVDVTITRRALPVPSVFIVEAREAFIRINNVALPTHATGWYYRYAESEALLASATSSAKQATSAISADITGLTAGTPYYIQIQAEGTGNYMNSQWSAAQSIAPVAPSGAYALLSSSDPLMEDNLNGAEITVALTNATFNALTSEVFSDYYVISGLPAGVTQSAFSSTSALDEDATITLAMADDVDLDISGIISVVVKSAAHNGADDLPAASITYTATVELAPGAVSNFAAVSRNGAVKLSWNNVAGATGYEFERKRSSDLNWDAPVSLSASASPHLVVGLTNNTTYDFRIRAIKAKAENGTWSSVVSATPMLPSVSASTTPTTLTEETLNNASISLSLSNAEFEAASEITDADFSVAGISGVSVKAGSATRDSATTASLSLAYDGTDFDTPENLSLIVRASALLNDNSSISTTVSVARVLESAALVLSASTEGALGSTFTLTVTLTNEEFESGLSVSDFSASGLPLGAALSSASRTSGTVAVLTATYNGRDFDSDAEIAVTCLASGLSRNAAVVSNTQTITARTETAALTASVPLTEDNLGSVSLTTTLTGEEYNASIQVSDFSLGFFDQSGNALTLASNVNVATVMRTSNTAATLTLSTTAQFDLDIPASLRVTAMPSGHSGEDSLTTNALPMTATAEPAPLAPTGLAAVPHIGRVVVSWDDPSDPDITKYQSRRRLSSGPAFQDSHWTNISGSGMNTTAHEFAGLTNEAAYVFEIRAIKAYNFPPGLSASVTAVPGAPSAETTELSPEIPTEDDILISMTISLDRREFVASPMRTDFEIVNWGGDFGIRYVDVLADGDGVEGSGRTGLLVAVKDGRLPPYWFSADAEWDRLVALVGIGPTGRFRFETGIIGHTMGPELASIMRTSIAVMMKSGDHSFIVKGFPFDSTEPYDGQPANASEIAAFHAAVQTGDEVEIVIWDTRTFTVQSVNRVSDTEAELTIEAIPATLETQDFDETINFLAHVLPSAHNGAELLTTGAREMRARTDVEYAAHSLVNRTHLDEENLPGATTRVVLHRAEFSASLVGANVVRRVILGNSMDSDDPYYIPVNFSATSSTTAEFTIPTTYAVPSFLGQDTTLTVPFAPNDVNGKEIPEIAIVVTATMSIIANPVSSFMSYDGNSPLSMEKDEMRTWILSYHFIDPGQPDDSRMVYSVSPSMPVQGLTAIVAGDRLTLEAGDDISDSPAVFTITASRALSDVFTAVTGSAQTHVLPANTDIVSLSHSDSGASFDDDPQDAATDVIADGNWHLGGTTLTYWTDTAGTVMVATTNTANIAFHAEVSDIFLKFRPTPDFPSKGITAIVGRISPLVRLDDSFQHPANTEFSADAVGSTHKAIDVDIGTGFDLMARRNPCVTRFFPSSA